jgi:uncharacterized protein YqeY
MNISDQINNDIKEAMKARETGRLAALRDVKSKLLLEATREGGDGTVDDATAMKVLNKLYKQRIEAADIYKAQNREDLLADELTQAEVIKAYLPAQLSDAELKSSIEQIIARVGASSMAEMGKVMGVASQELGGKADGKAIAAMVKVLLG